MITFTDGEGRESEHEGVEAIVGRLSAHDPAFWNGRTGQSCLERREEEAVTYLYLSLVPDADLYWIVLQFADRSKVSPRDRGAAPQTHRLWIGGQPLDIKKENLVGAGTAGDIIEHFARTGQPHPDVHWDFT